MTGAEHMDEPMTTAEAARHLELNPGYLSNLRSWGTGPGWRRVGARDVRYEKRDLDQWKNARNARLDRERGE